METNTNTNSTQQKSTPQVKSSATQVAPKNDWEKRDIGALWKREGKQQKYLSGHIKFSDEFGSERKLDIMVFSNKNKKADNQPDFRVYFNDRATPQNKPAVPAASTRQAAPDKTVEEDDMV